MHLVDYIIFVLYLMTVLGIGVYFFFRNKNAEDYYVGGRSIDAKHVGLSIVATDVGGGFSIGLGGLGFSMGLAGSWLLFTGLLGAWLSAALIIPRLKRIDRKYGMFTYSDFLKTRYSSYVAILAALISGIGYLGFTGGQILAGAKLASATMFSDLPLDMDPMTFSLFVLAVITIGYTVIGGLKAVIYTDTVQWIILLTGLIFVTIPVAIYKIGGITVIMEKLPASHFDLLNISPVTFINWMVTIIPIWLIAMTLYQRMYACRDEAEAKKAWYIAGIFEYPIMAFMGVILGMCARIVFPEAEPEHGLPMLIKEVLPIGVTGIVIASYFSAIMSTADSCMMASSGNFVNDIIEKLFMKDAPEKKIFRISQIVTFLIGTGALVLAAYFNTVLNAILTAYSFMVSGLFIPTLGAYFWKKGTSFAAFSAMLTGGGFSLVAIIFNLKMPYGFDASLFGILISLFFFVLFSYLKPERFFKV